MTAIHDEEAALNPSAEPHLSTLIEARLSRRGVLTGGMAAVAGYFATSLLGPSAALAATGQGRSTAQATRLLGFDPVPLGYGDEVVVPRGYTAMPFLAWARRCSRASTSASTRRR